MGGKATGHAESVQGSKHGNGSDVRVEVEGVKAQPPAVPFKSINTLIKFNSADSEAEPGDPEGWGAHGESARAGGSMLRGIFVHGVRKVIAGGSAEL
jgi:hypothetical protein